MENLVLNTFRALMDDIQLPPPRKKAKEPVNAYEFCQAFSKMTGMPVGYFLKLAGSWEKDGKTHWFHDIVSVAKASNNQKLAILKWFADYRKSLKEIN